MTALTVTATASGAQEIMGALAVRVLTGSAASQPGTIDPEQTSPPTALFTPEATGSVVYGAIQVFPGTTTLTAVPGTTVISSDSTEDVSYGTTITTGLVAGTAVTVGASAPAGEFNAVAFAEILPADGETLAEDASTPAGPLTSETAPFLTTAEFDPPAGARLVAIVSALAETSVITDTMGLTWTSLVAIGTLCQIWTAVVPSASTPPAAGGSALMASGLC